jgi:transcriptional regulator with XRE-family HTH domain
MATGTSSPMASRWELAARLRALRETAGKSIEDAARELMCSQAKISRMETAGRGIQDRDIRDLSRFYSVPDEIKADLMRLASEARQRGWWQDYSTIDEQTANFTGLEAAASEIRVLEARVPGGLLQTPAMTEAILSGMRPPGELTDQWIKETVELRQHRQQRLLSGELRFSTIMDEAAFARHFTAPQAWAEQLDHLLAVAELPNVTLQVVTFKAGSYPGVDGSFQYLRFDSTDLPDVVYVEGFLGNFTLDKAATVRRYVEVYEHIAAQVALDPDETRHWMAERRLALEPPPVGRRKRR